MAWGGKLTCQSQEKAVVNRESLENLAWTAQPFPATPALHCPSPHPQFCRRPSSFHFHGLESSRLAWWGHTLRKVGITLASCPGFETVSVKAGTASVKFPAKVPDEQFSDRHRVNGQWPVSQRMGGGAASQIGCHKKKVHGS